MHKINVLAFGPEKFNTSLEELKDHLNFRLTTIHNNLKKHHSKIMTFICP